MKAYSDTSVVVAAVLREASWPAIDRFLHLNQPELVASNLCRGEFAAAVGRKVISGTLSDSLAAEAVRDADQWFLDWEQTDCSPPDFLRARDHVLRFELKLRYPDALHIAVAERMGCTLVSLDKRQVAAARMLGLPVLNPIDGSHAA